MISYIIPYGVSSAVPPATMTTMTTLHVHGLPHRPSWMSSAMDFFGSDLERRAGAGPDARGRPGERFPQVSDPQ